MNDHGLFIKLNSCCLEWVTKELDEKTVEWREAHEGKRKFYTGPTLEFHSEKTTILDENGQPRTNVLESAQTVGCVRVRLDDDPGLDKQSCWVELFWDENDDEPIVSFCLRESDFLFLKTAVETAIDCEEWMRFIQELPEKADSP